MKNRQKIKTEASSIPPSAAAKYHKEQAANLARAMFESRCGVKLLREPARAEDVAPAPEQRP